jgi:hypothetical protein
LWGRFDEALAPPCAALAARHPPRGTALGDWQSQIAGALDFVLAPPLSMAMALLYRAAWLRRTQQRFFGF